MDLDVFVSAHRAEWDRLDALLRRRRTLTGAETDELVTLYQRTATHLSLIQSSAPDPQLTGRLTQLVARARSTVTGTRRASRHIAPGGAASSCDGTTRACHELAEPTGELRVGGAGLDQREVGGGALVEGDEFVGLGAGEAAPAAQQCVEAVPFGSVGGDEDVEVHRFACSSAVRRRPVVSVSLSYCGAMRLQLGRLAVPGAGQGRTAGVSELVTGEAVALELRPAKLPSRALAVLLDLVVVVVGRTSP